MEQFELTITAEIPQDLQKIMDYADSVLKPYKKPDTQDQLTLAL